MEAFGFIHEKLDIKILLLFLMSRLSGAVNQETIFELCRCDEGIGYFDFSDCLAELVENGHVIRSEEGYRITEKGKKNSQAVESSLPYSVRTKALKLLAPVEEMLQRAAMITAEHTVSEDGCHVRLAVSDGKGSIIDLTLLCSDEENAKNMEKNFRKNAEDLYHKIAELLCGEK